MHVKPFYPSSKQVGELEINFITQFNLKVRTQGLALCMKGLSSRRNFGNRNAHNFRGPIRGI